jgi:hypothetical protein
MSSTIGSIRRVICDFVAPSRIVSDPGQWNTMEIQAIDRPYSIKHNAKEDEDDYVEVDFESL